MRARSPLAAALLAAVLATACATPGPPPAETLELGFLDDGATRREQVALRLGLPSRVFESDRILIYRMQWSPERGLHPVPWHQALLAAYDLVLVFDERGVLAQHALVAK